MRMLRPPVRAMVQGCRCGQVWIHAQAGVAVGIVGTMKGYPDCKTDLASTDDTCKGAEVAPKEEDAKGECRLL